MRTNGRIAGLVLGVAMLGFVLLAPTASAQTCPDSGHAGVVTCGSGQVLAESITPAAAADPVAVHSSALPLTGADVLGLLTIAIVAVAAGVVFVRFSRKLRPPTS
jgi:hypothetical protein